MKSKIKLFTILSSISLMSIAQGSVQVQNSIIRINQDASAKRKNTPSSPRINGDLMQDCIASVFKKWSASYLNILKVTPIQNYKSISTNLNDFATQIDTYERIYTLGTIHRQNLETGLESAFKTAQNVHSQYFPMGVASINPSVFTLSEFQEPLFIQSLQLCQTNDFINAIIPLVGAADETAPVPPAFTNPRDYDWRISANGGIEPYETDGNIHEADAVVFGTQTGADREAYTTPVSYEEAMRILTEQN